MKKEDILPALGIICVIGGTIILTYSTLHSFIYDDLSISLLVLGLAFISMWSLRRLEMCKKIKKLGGDKI